MDKDKEPSPAGLKLGDVWVARESWAHLMRQRSDPTITYRLFKYYKGVADDLAAISAKNNEIITRIGKPDGDGRPSVKTGTPEFTEYQKEFGAFLDQPSDLKRAPFDLDALHRGITTDVNGNKIPGNTISGDDWGFLEPFFNQKGVEEETG